MFDICCIGHITLDKLVTPELVKHMPGGTAYYFSHAIRAMPLRYLLVTSLGKNEMNTVTELQAIGLEVLAYQSTSSVYFENIYSTNLDERTQQVLFKADPFATPQVTAIDAKIFHLGPLLADDMSAAFIKDLAARGRVSLDVQGFLRTVDNKKVVLADWSEKKEILQHVVILKANEEEMKVITGCTQAEDGALLLAAWGVKEVVITFGSKGSLIYTKGIFYTIPAFAPRYIADTTGCGDTYMAGYLAQRINGRSPKDAGIFAAAMAALKIETFGPFTGTPEEVLKFMAAE